MEPFFTAADIFTRNALHTRANSALPQAPVQPYIERRTLKSRVAAGARRYVRRPLFEIRRPSYRTECTSP